jgi:hypothetical protein
MLVSPKVNQEMKIADEMLRIDEKTGIAFEMMNETIQKRLPIPIQRLQVKVLCTFTWSGLVFRMIVMYCTKVSVSIKLSEIEGSYHKFDCSNTNDQSCA